MSEAHALRSYSRPARPGCIELGAERRVLLCSNKKSHPQRDGTVDSRGTTLLAPTRRGHLARTPSRPRSANGKRPRPGLLPAPLGDRVQLAAQEGCSAGPCRVRSHRTGLAGRGSPAYSAPSQPFVAMLGRKRSTGVEMRQGRVHPAPTCGVPGAAFSMTLSSPRRDVAKGRLWRLLRTPLLAYPSRRLSTAWAISVVPRTRAPSVATSAVR